MTTLRMYLYVYPCSSCVHYNNKKKSKGIYGSASKEDLKELKEEGIDAQMIPWIDEKEN